MEIVNRENTVEMDEKVRDRDRGCLNRQVRARGSNFLYTYSRHS